MLALFAVSNAGYFAQASYAAYLEKGWYLKTLDDDPGNPLLFIGTIATVALAPLAVASLWRRISPYIVLCLIVPAWIGISAVWSDVLPQTLVIVAKMMIYVLAIGEAVRPLSYTSTVRCVALMALIICITSLALGFSDPIFRISIGAEGWRGLFEQKNRFAMFALFSLLLIFPTVFNRQTRILGLSTLPILMACLILSQGKSSLALAVTYMVICGVFAVFWRGSKSGLLWTSVVLVALLLLSAVTIAILLFMVGVTFTGRVGLWQWFFDDLGNRMMAGAGGASAPLDPGLVRRAELSNRAPTSDSSYVMLVYNQGIIGIILYFTVIGAMWARCVKLGSAYAIYPITTLATYVIFAFVESDARFNLSYPTVALLIQMLVLEKFARQIDSTSDVIDTGTNTFQQALPRRIG